MGEIKPGYARVTDILKPYSNFDMIPKEILEHKKEIGTEVHQAIYDYSKGIPESFEHPESEFYFISFLKWYKEFEIKFIENELRLYDEELRITGGIDAVIKFPHENSLVLVDWKTVASMTKPMSISWEMQGTFYHHLLQVNGYKTLSGRFLFIQLSADGDIPRVKKFEFDQKTMADCHAALQVYKRFHG